MVKLEDVPISKIKIVENVRTELGDMTWLMQSIKQEGLQSPIGVWKEDNEYVMKFGHRRLDACKKLGWKTIPAVVGDKGLSEDEFLIANLTENIHRLDNSPVEIGRVCHRLKDEHDMSTSEVAARLSIPVGRVEQSIRIYKNVPEKHRKNIGFSPSSLNKKGKISMVVANHIAQARLTEATLSRVFDVAHKDELGYYQVKILIKLLEKGVPMVTAKSKLDKVRVVHSTLIVDKKVAVELENVYDMNITKVVDEMLKGEISLRKGLIAT